MPDERPRGSCLIDGCPRDPWPRDDGRTPLVCGPDVSRLRTWLRDIPVLVDELVARDAPEEPTVRSDVRPLLAGWHPPLALRLELLMVASALPAAAVGVAGRGGRVSGSSEPRLPIATDAVDLLGPARSIRRVEDDDQVGFLPVASTLDFWVQDLRDHRGRGEGLPEPSVTVLARWLLDRIDEACDDWLPVDEFFEDIRRAHGALRGQLGLVDVPEYKPGVPCARCSTLSLLRRPGSDYVECGSCPALLTIDEYEEHVLTMSTEAVAERRRRVAERRAVVRLLREMHAVGWRHQIVHQVGHDPETGGLEPYKTHRWTRGDESIEVDRIDGRLLGYLGYRPHPEAEAEEMVHVGVAWAASVGTKRLHSTVSAAGVLSLPREAK